MTCPRRASRYDGFPSAEIIAWRFGRIGAFRDGRCHVWEARLAEYIEVAQTLDKVKDFTPLQRILLTATGTLQGVLSAYFGQQVRVVVRKQAVEDRWVVHRVADLMAGELVVCHADSQITLTLDKVREELLAKQKGIGQILEALGIRPEFRLLEVGRGDGDFWRVYKLEGPGVVYRITETFPEGLFV